ASDDPASDDPASDDPASDDPASDDPASDDPASDDPASGAPASDDGAPGDGALPEDTPAWLRLLVRLLENTGEVLRLLSDRFDVVGALEDAGGDPSAENEVGRLPVEVSGSSSGGGGDWD
ncbi:MAG TPA: hypothetical protein RMH99_12590, partial [Sandaracinaceae bacterium LLY-WYZ-13_1]|nr:hypothetical protein [Sandaracinaceae bacterium LLY-WYZ-13_1]